MTAAAAEALTRSAVRISLDAGGVTLSGLLSGPEHLPPRAVVVALHGGGMSAGYFDGQAHPDVSLLALGAELGYAVLALDRPGYRASAAQLPEGQTLMEQATTLRLALADFSRRYPTGAGLFLLAHSYGGKVALIAAGEAGQDPPGLELLGVDVSGCGHRYAVAPRQLPDDRRHGHWTQNWGPLRLYPPNTFRASATLVAPMPVRERQEAACWPDMFPDVAARIRIPVRLTFAEYERWWLHDDESLADLTGRLTGAPRVVVDRQPRAGHNISLGWGARSYHLHALAFLEECLTSRQP